MTPDEPLTDPNLNYLYFNKPGLVIRIKSIIIDSAILIGMVFLASGLINSIEIESATLRVILLGLIILYEPIMITLGSTIGQKIMGIRVVNFGVYKKKEEVRKLNFISSLIRYIFKLILGWISLLTIFSDRYGRAIHDNLSNSLVIYSK